MKTKAIKLIKSKPVMVAVKIILAIFAGALAILSVFGFMLWKEDRRHFI